MTTAPNLSVLQKLRDERVGQDIERFVQVGPSVVRRHTGAEANAVVRHGWIIDRRDEETAAPQLMTETVHATAISNDERHDVGR